ncbi:MAG: S-methyl-5-thioribose-1-phosphate isomerase [Desulfobacterales bacterium]|jgi:methylthioribose-1-phosphate isomerase|nr:S-methyl-5-thioribose-1-phosphate isomerase [Desulfobacterales bacterium]
MDAHKPKPTPQPVRSIWLDEADGEVKVIDQRRLPHEFIIQPLATVDDAIRAISTMTVRGAPLIGVTAAYGLYLAARQAAERNLGIDYLESAARQLRATRPTAVNLAWAVDRVWQALAGESDGRQRVAQSRTAAAAIAEEEVENCRKIGAYGSPIIESLSRARNGKTVHILTHCNAGWLACIRYGTATAPIYAAVDRGIDLHVWVDETRPLNQGSRLTAWELGQYGVRHTVITDNAGGHLMQQGQVDLVIVGSDRTTRGGDVANKIGTYLKALAARDNAIPFYVALPSSTFDWDLTGGGREIPIEERDPDEVRYVEGWDGAGQRRVRLCPELSAAANFAFDVTPARLVTGLITERGICQATADDIGRLFPDKAKQAVSAPGHLDI